MAFPIVVEPGEGLVKVRFPVFHRTEVTLEVTHIQKGLGWAPVIRGETDERTKYPYRTGAYERYKYKTIRAEMR
jgi:hypothetical protein